MILKPSKVKYWINERFGKDSLIGTDKFIL
jgi:hypothetical protein